MTSPDATNVDTTDDGQGGTGPGVEPPASNNETSALDGGAEFQGTDPDLTGDPDAGVRNPETDVTDTTGANSSTRTYRTGDVDPGTSNPQELGDRQPGHGVGQAYRAPQEAPGATNFDTASGSGVLAVEPTSPDREVVGSSGGVNPNAVEPGFTNASNSVTQVDTSGYGGSGPSHVPAGTGVPQAPTGVFATVVPNRRAVIVHWTAPANAGPTGVLGYVIESNTLGTQMVGKDDSEVEFEEGLIGGDVYTFTVYARTANGNGYRSAASAPVTISKDDLTADDTVAEGLQEDRPSSPAAPAAPVATVAGPTSASVAFTAPDSSDPITGYRVTASTGQVVEGAASPIVVTGLTTATPVTFTVAAENVYGYGAESAASNSVTPA